VRAGELAAHCELIASCCTPTSLADLRRAVLDGSPLPARPVLVTFDDGYRNVAMLAAPILERYRIPAAFFVCTSSIAERRLLWYDAIARRGVEADAERMKRLPFADWRRLDRDTRTVVDNDDPLAPMTLQDVQALAAHPLFEFGSHSASHPVLASAPVSAQRDEIVTSLRVLETWTGKPVTAFAYPNGQPAIDYTDETVALLREARVRLAFTTRAGYAGAGEAALEQPRFLMLTGISQSELAHRLAYSWRRVA